ncbi:MAG: alpha/beta hydrolase [Cryomorphaceae bacterium]|nr:alpha/beta hydrolase [Cryomorphaceae bacterium]
MIHKFITYKGVKIHYTTQGKGEAVVLLHGFLEDARMWTLTKKYLPKTFKIICIDLFGHGQSEGLGYIYHMEEMAEAVFAVINNERVKKIHLAGHSMGGYVSIAFAEKFPDALRSLSMIHSTSRPDSKSKRADRERAIALVKRDHKGFTAHAIPLLFSEKARKNNLASIETLKKRAAEIPAGQIAASLEGMKIRKDREAILHFAPYPILFIGGKTDTVISIADTEEQMAAHSVTGIWQNTAHMGPWEMPKKTADILKRFWKDSKHHVVLHAQKTRE